MKVFPLSCSFDNYSYLLVCEKTGVCGVVDPTEAYPAWQKAQSLSVQLKKVFCTHHHHDHVAGLADLLEEQPELEVYGYHSDAGRINGMNVTVEDGSHVILGECEGRVLHTPGHTTGSVCYHFGEHLFTGDTLFGGGCGRLFEGTADEMYVSLGRIAMLDESTKVYFGHEYTEVNMAFALAVEKDNPEVRERFDRVKELRGLNFPTSPSTVLDEKRTNPFLRCDEQTVRNGLGDRAGRLDSVEVFRLLREQRNHFSM